jgi:uncharacterized protein (TIRG00374 family)
MRSRLRLWLGVVVSTVFVVLAVRGLGIDEFLSELRGARYEWLVPAVAVYGLAVVARTWRWQTMLRPIDHVPLAKLFPIVCIGYMGNNIYPARAGELLRSYVLKNDTGIRMSASLATVVVERLFDGLTMLLFIFVALPFMSFESDTLEEYRGLVVVATVLFLVALGVALFFAGRPHLVRGVYGRVVEVVIPGAQRESVIAGLDRFMLGFESLARRREFARILGSSVLIWLFETMKYWFVMHAFPMQVSFLTLMLVNGFVNLATSIPAAPGYIGTFDLVAIKILEAARVPRDVATAYTLVLHVALWLPITVLGGFYLWRHRISLAQATAAIEAQRARDGGDE